MTSPTTLSFWASFPKNLKGKQSKILDCVQDDKPYYPVILSLFCEES